MAYNQGFPRIFISLAVFSYKVIFKDRHHFSTTNKTKYTNKRQCYPAHKGNLKQPCLRHYGYTIEVQ